MASDVHGDDRNRMDLNAQFALFSKLPKEIRDEIWSYSFTFISPRTIELVTVHSLFGVDGKQIPLENRVGAKPAPVPLIFQVCVEARERATKEFAKEFRDLVDNGPIFFDFAKDTILFDSLETYNNLFRKDHCSLRGLVEREDDVRRALCHVEQNLRFMAIKDCITSHSHSDFRRLYSLEQITFLDDSYRYWPLRPDFEARLLPNTLFRPSFRLRIIDLHEFFLQREWVFARIRDCRGLMSELPKIRYMDLYDMVPSM